MAKAVKEVWRALVMDFRKLEYYEAVCRHKNFTKAAEELHVAQPSITTAIRSLEQDLGVKLLKRSKRSVSLTIEGEIFYQKAIKILGDVSNTVNQMRDLGNASQKIVRLGIPPILGATIYNQIINGFLACYPEVRLQVSELGSYDIAEELLKGGIDLGYMVYPSEEIDKFHSALIVEGDIHVIMHRDNPLAAYDRVAITEIAQQPIYQLPISTFVRTAMNEQFKRAGLEAQILYEPTQIITTFELISSGKGICFILNHNMNILKHNPLLTTRPLADPIPYKAGFFWSKENYLPEIAKKLIKYIQAHV